jgi:LmbE family N-acetylglucosaminyl deacetylase
MTVFLSPHNDDETLFGAYTLLRYRPLVIVCFRSAGDWGPAAVREAETAAAMNVLDCQWQQWSHPDTPRIPDWTKVEQSLLTLEEPGRVWAPAPEEDGHDQHNGIGELAARLWPDRVTWYTTYTRHGGRSDWGEPVPYEPHWPRLKQAALDCYESQARDPRTGKHFRRPLDEFYAPRSPNALS